MGVGSGGGRVRPPAGAGTGENGTSALYVQLRPLLVVLQMFGILPASLDNPHGPVFRWRSPAMLFAAAMWLTIGTIACFSAGFQMDWLLCAVRLHHRFYEKAFATLGLTLLFYLPLLPVVWGETGAPCKLIASWRAIESDYEALTGRHLPLQLHRSCRIFVTAILLVSLPLTASMSISVPQYQLWRVLPIMQYNAFIMGVPALWWCLCKALAQASAALAATLVEVPVDKAAVRAHGALWVQLNDALIALGARWGHTKYFLMLLLFVEWVIAAFTVMSELLSNEDVNFIVLLSHIALFSGSMLFISCSGAQRALDAVGRCSLRALLRLPISRMDEKVATEVALVLTSIQAASKEEVLVNGFIGYNRATLVTFLKNTATYLVVLVQFASSLA